MKSAIRNAIAACLVLAGVQQAPAQQGPVIPAGDKEPLLRLEAGGPTSFVTALTFSPDGKRLYAAGFDKVVRIWTLNAQNKFVLDAASYRVPIGPGIDGTINAMALSPDERWLAVGGQGIVRGAATFRMPGLILPKTGAFTEEMWLDQGTIYVFDTQNRSVKPLRGHLGPVWNLAFAPTQAGKPATLVSAGRDRNLEDNTYRGSVRAWNVEDGTQLAVRNDLPGGDRVRPAIDAWHTGKNAKQMQVGIAWQDGKFRVWDVASGQLASEDDGWSDKSNYFNNTAAYVPGQKRVVTLTREAARDGKRGFAQIRLWDVGLAAPKVADTKPIRLEGSDLFPRGLALASSKGDGTQDLAVTAMAWVYKEDDVFKQDTYLYLRSLKADNFGAAVKNVRLWPDAQRLPSVATAPEGRFIAVAGDRSNAIRIYSIADVLAKDSGTAEPVQLLRSSGTTFGFVAFVRKGEDRGLLLNQTVQPLKGGTPRQPGAKGDVIFEIAQRRFTSDLEGWKLDTPDVTGWSVEAKAAVRPQDKEPTPATVTVRKQGKVNGTITMEPQLDPSDAAFLPPTAPLNLPLLAVAAHDLGQPRLDLYDANTGTPLRRFTGHSERIFCLAFSADGKYLASVGDDQTICVWSLFKLDKWVIDKLGALPDVAVKNLLVVDRADPATKLQAYDVVEGIVRGGEVEQFFSLGKLNRELNAMKPGATVKLRTQRPGGNQLDVDVPVNRGFVERTRCLLLNFGEHSPLAVASLANSAEQLSPLSGLALKYAPSVAASKLEALVKGDVIESIAEGNNAGKPLNTAFQFYEAIALMKPGTKARLAVRGKGNVVVVVGQGSDERKPLFSLFVNRTERVAEWEWVGWSPIGPYEASDRQAERHIGWHFNTGDPLRPASFALADQYRKEYYRQGILNDLMVRGDLSAALHEWEQRNLEKPLPPPRMTLYVDAVGPNPEARNAQGQVVTRDNPALLKLAIDDFPSDRIESVQWQADNGPMQSFEGQGRERKADLPLQRGVVRLRAVVKTYETPPREYTQELLVRFVPPAPVLKPGTARFDVVRDPAYIVKAVAAQVQPDQEVTIHLDHRAGGNKVAERDWSIGKAKGDKPEALPIEAQVKLQPGHNFIEVVAVNKSADPAEKDIETTRLTWVIEHVAPEVKVAPPQIVLEQLVASAASGAGEPPVVIEPGRTVIVNESPVKLLGRISSTDSLASASVDGKALAGFAAGKDKMFSIAQDVNLQPGEQTITLTAKADRGDAATMKLTVDYRPKLPEVVMTAPAAGAMVYDEGKGAGPLEVLGSVRPRNPHPAKAELLVNNMPTPIDMSSPEWSVMVKNLSPGVNRLRIRLSNQWGQEWISDAVVVRQVRPPHAIRFDPAGKAEKPLIDLLARVESPLPLIRETVKADVDGREISEVEIVLPEKLEGKWGVRLKDVPLEAGQPNKVRVWVSNPEARCRVPGEIAVPFVPMVKPPAQAEVRFVDPLNEINVVDPDLPVRIRVKSESPLKRVELVREAGRDVGRQTFDLSDKKPDAQGAYEFQAVLRLAPRENRLKAVAVNAGGEQETTLVVNYLYMPVRLEVDALAPLSKPKDTAAPKRLPDGRLVFESKAEQSRMVLKGRVQWSKENDEQIRKTSLVRVYVNGFQQLPAELKPASGDGRERRFEAELLLNRALDNVVEIELPDLKQDSSNRREFNLACAKPEEGQRLHLLVVAVGEKNNPNLIDTALLSLRATRDKGQIKTPAFSQVRVYGPLTDFVTPQHVFTQLCLIKKTIDVLASQGSPNDVVMVYYQGGEAVQNEGNVFETSLTKYDKELKRSGISLGGLQGFFDETLGAKLLWLDVAKVPSKDQLAKDQVTKMSPNTYFNVLRYRWVDPKAGSRSDGSLLSDLGKAMQKDQAGFLQSVSAKVADMYKENKSPVTYDSFVPDGLEKLLVDRKQ